MSTITITSELVVSPLTDQINPNHLFQNHQQPSDDCFVDASDVLLAQEDAQVLHGQITCQDQKHLQHESPERQTSGVSGDDQELGASLSETAHILRLALSNEFIRAVEICEPR